MTRNLVQLSTHEHQTRPEVLNFEPLSQGTTCRVLFVYPNVQRVRTPQLGIAVLSSCLKLIGVKTRLFDTTTLPRGQEGEPFAHLLDEFDPDLIAYSVRSNEWALVRELIECGARPGVPQILGGPHATHAPDESIPFADALVLGEGEGALLDIARAVAAGRSLEGIPNTWVNTPGGVIKTPTRDLIDNLDDVPLPDWGLFDAVHYTDSYICSQMGDDIEVVAAIEGSRGCPFTCTYCSNPALMRDYKGKGRWRREKSPERMIEELEAFRSQRGRLDFVYWVDEIWLTATDRLSRFRDLYKSRIGVPFSIMERPECISQQKLELIADAGLHYIAIGLESGDEDLRAGLLNRRTNLQALKRAFELPRQYGIRVHAFTMVGLPGQDEASLLKTWAFMREVRPTTAQFSFFYPLKGTTLHDHSVQMGIYDPRETVESYHAGSVLHQDDVIDPRLQIRYHRLLSEYAARPGIWPVVAFHLCRKSRLAYWGLFVLLPPPARWLRRQMHRLNTLLHCTPRQALRKIGANVVDVFHAVAVAVSRRSVHGKT